MTIPPYYPDGGPGGVVFSGQSCSADFTTSGLSVQGYESLSFEFSWESMSATGGATFSVESSNSNVGYNLKESGGATASFEVEAASGTQIINLNQVVSESYYRVVFNNGTNATGAATCIMVGK